jgi:hypothetical protein
MCSNDLGCAKSMLAIHIALKINLGFCSLSDPKGEPGEPGSGLPNPHPSWDS